ncbi:MAG: hypothetical protein ACREK8_10020, partial [Gemmatimonadales bacterium]
MPAVRWSFAVTLLTFAALAATSASGQGGAAAVRDSSPFRPLQLPAGNTYREGSGRPGPLYWQQRVDYRIDATLDPAQNEVRGRETIHYVNRSPDALPYLWLFVEQNLCAPSSITNVLNQPPLVFLGSAFDFSCQGFNGGLVLDYVRRHLAVGRVTRDSAGLPHTVYGTTMRVDLPAPLHAGASIDLDLGWSFHVPAQGGGRMGHDGPLYE